MRAELMELDPELRTRLEQVREEGRQVFRQFDQEVRRQNFHPFMPADYEQVLVSLLPLREPGLRFLEWGSATGIVAIMADMIGFEAYGIELDANLVDTARALAARFHSGARFAAGSFLPSGYRWVSPDGDERLGTIGHGVSGYEELGLDLADFDLVFGYPWSGEEPTMLDLMDRRGRPGARLLIPGGGGLRIYRNGGFE